QARAAADATSSPVPAPASTTPVPADSPSARERFDLACTEAAAVRIIGAGSRARVYKPSLLARSLRLRQDAARLAAVTAAAAGEPRRKGPSSYPPTIAARTAVWALSTGGTPSTAVTCPFTSQA